jgi:hypothetical protein
LQGFVVTENNKTLSLKTLDAPGAVMETNNMKKIAFAFVVLIGAVSSASAQNTKIMGGGYGPYGIGTNQNGTLVNPYVTHWKNVQSQTSPTPTKAGTNKRRY